jgi:polyhydroxyalkanoate synthesis regulator phasin
MEKDMEEAVKWLKYLREGKTYMYQNRYKYAQIILNALVECGKISKEECEEIITEQDHSW